MSNSNILLSNSKPCRLHSSAMTERIRHKITHVRTGCQHVIDDVYLTSHGGEPVTALFAHVHIHILCLNRSKLCNLYFIVGGRLHLGVIGEPLALVQPIEASVNVFAALTFDTWVAAALTSHAGPRCLRRPASASAAPPHQPRVQLPDMAAFKALCSADSVFFRTLSGCRRARLNNIYLQLNKVGTETLPIPHWLINY